MGEESTEVQGRNHSCRTDLSLSDLIRQFMVLEKTKDWITQSSMPSGLTRGWAMTNGEGLDYPVKPAPEGINRGPGNDRNKRYDILQCLLTWLRGLDR